MESQNDQLLYRFSKDRNEEVRFSIRTLKSKEYLDIRIWFPAKKSADYFPSKKGLFLPMEYLSEVANGMSRLLCFRPKNTSPATSNTVHGAKPVPGAGAKTLETAGVRID